MQYIGNDSEWSLSIFIDELGIPFSTNFWTGETMGYSSISIMIWLSSVFV